MAVQYFDSLKFKSNEKEVSLFVGNSLNDSEIMRVDYRGLIIEAKYSNENQSGFIYSSDDSTVFLQLRLLETIEYFCQTPHGIKAIIPSCSDFKQINENLVSFKYLNYLGKSRIILEYDEIKNIAIEFEVISKKIDYETEYKAITEDIARLCSHLLLDHYSPVALNFSHNPEIINKTALEQFIFLRTFCTENNLQYYFSAIKQNPSRELEEYNNMALLYNAKPGKAFYSNPFSYSRGWNNKNGKWLPEMIIDSKKYDTFDTPPNRFIKYILLQFREICQNVKEYTERKRFLSSEYNNEAQNMIIILDVILSDPFFDNVSDNFNILPESSQVLQKSEGYSPIFSAWLMSNMALQLDWEGLNVSYKGEVKNTALLYEYWLFIVLFYLIKDIVKDTIQPEFKNEESDFIKKIDLFTISLKQGKESKSSFIYKHENKYLKILLYYNREFVYTGFNNGENYSGSWSRKFRPDYTIAMFPIIDDDYTEERAVEDGNISFLHFDAKYRIEKITELFSDENEESLDDKEYSFNYKRDDLLKMHTYNDAIRRSVGSYVLYPGDKSKEFREYDELLPGVGAFPVKPNTDGTIRGLDTLRNFIKSSIEFKLNNATRNYRNESFKNMVITDPNSANQRVPSQNKDFLMIGYIRDKYNKYLISNKYLSPGKTFLYYYYAIDNEGFVYPRHPNLHKTNIFRAYTDGTEFAKEIKLLPWEAEIISTELISEKILLERLPIKEHNPKISFYYIVNLKYLRPASEKIVKNIDDFEGNDTVRTAAPKIIPLRVNFG